MHDYMTYDYMQPGCGYAASERAAQIIADTRVFLQTFVNGNNHGQVRNPPFPACYAHLVHL
jgi:hypothetical protein